MCGWCEAAFRAPGGQAAERFGDLAPHGVAFGWLFACLLAGLVGCLLFALIALPPSAVPPSAAPPAVRRGGTPRPSSARVVLTVAAGSGALATVLGAALGRPWLLVAALTVLAGVAREGPRRWLPATVFALVAVLAVLEPATILAPLGGLAAYAIARRPADLTDRVAPLVAAGLIVVAAAGFRAPPPVAPPPVMRTATVADLTVSLVQAGRGVTVLAASARRPPPAPISEVSLDLGGRTVGLFPGAAGRYAGTADLPAAGSAVRATVIVRRAGERLTVPLAWTVPGSSPAPFPLSRAGLLVLAVLTLAAVHRKIAKDVP